MKDLFLPFDKSANIGSDQRYQPIAPGAASATPRSDAPVKVVPKPSGSSAGVGINNLKPGQKIKVTIKTGGTKK